MDDAGYKIASVVCGFAYTFGVICGCGMCRENYRTEAIKHNAAYYSPDTGEFTWRNNKAIKQEDK